MTSPPITQEENGAHMTTTVGSSVQHIFFSQSWRLVKICSSLLSVNIKLFMHNPTNRTENPYNHSCVVHRASNSKDGTSACNATMRCGIEP